MDEVEDYTYYGTPLPDLEDDVSLRKKASQELQVRDEKGRQRFHGAFTGGFSAGYFNTVGTKEGWAPSSFVSSRKKTSDRIQQNPEDFMDDEDFGEFGIATRKIHTRTNFQDSSLDDSAKERKFVNFDAIIPGDEPLRELVKPVRESIGIKILKTMGWRQGQGIGPRVKKQQNLVKTYGCSLLPQDTNCEEEDPMMLRFTFAPEDTDTLHYLPKDNLFGLGYKGLSKKSILDAPIDLFSPTTTKSWLAKDKKKLRITGQAFGVGAYEDEDEDIYSKDDMSQYDFSEMAVTQMEGNGKSDDRSKQQCIPSDSVLEGFFIALIPVEVKKQYVAPTLPPNYRPIPTHAVKPHAPQVKLGRHLTSQHRSLILGENKFKSAGENAIELPQAKTLNKEPNTRMLNLSNKFSPSGFVPFSNENDKQRRYEQYLKLKSSGEIEKLVQPSSMTEWERQQELEEFSKAAVFFKPLSVGLSLRFESRSQLDVEHEVMSALQKIKTEKKEVAKVVPKKAVGSSSRETFEWHPVALLSKRFNVPNPYPNSNSSGVPNSQKPKKSLFNHLSCEMDHTEKSDAAELVSNDVKISENKADSSSRNESHKAPKEKNPMNNAQTITVTSAEEPSTKNTKPPMDFFKDIFENSSDEDNPPDEEPSDKSIPSPKSTEVEKNSGETDLKSPSVTIPDTTSHIDTNQPSTASKKAGFGVFANLDLDSLRRRTPLDKNSLLGDVQKGKVDSLPISTDCSDSIVDLESNVIDLTGSEAKTSMEVANDDYYGPEPPPNYSGNVHPLVETIPSKHVKHKSKHRHKHHKHKSEKHKKKKRSRKDSENSDSSDDTKDIPPSLILKKFKKLQKL